jgi:signal transduction histidine kinase
MWDVYPGIERTPLFARLTRCMNERTSETVENLFTFPDGSTRWFEIRVDPVPEGICVQSVDIQDRKEAERAREAMERRLHEQAALATIGQMAAVLVHEVKNPLAAVRGAIQVIGGRVGPNDAKIIGEIIARIDALSDLMKDLLLFARPPRLRPAPVDITSLLMDVAALLSHDPAAEHVTIDLPRSTCRLVADGDLLKGAFLNLLLNAAQAMQGHGTISVSVTQRAGFCVVEIADDGPGIPPAAREKLFTPFFTTKPRGTGLGLPTARRIVQEHGGTIEIECPADGGTRAIVRLPTIPGVAGTSTDPMAGTT